MAVGRRPPLARRSTSRTSTATGAILQMRIADPRRRVDAAPRRRPAADPRAARRRRPPARRATACSTRARSSTTTGSRSRRRARPRGSTSTATSRPAGARSVARVRRPPAVGAGDRRPRAGHRRPPQRLRLQRVPHQRRRAAAAVVDVGRLGPAAGRRLGVEAARRDRHRRSPATRCTRCSRTSRGTSPCTMSGAADDWAYEHLGVYAWTTEFWDVVHAATGEQAVDATSGTSARPTSRRWPCCAGSTSTHPDQLRRLVPVRPPAARPVELGGWHDLGHRGRTRRSTCCATRSPRTPSSPSPRRWPRRASRSSHTARRRPRRRHVAGRGRHRQHRLAADRTCRRAARKDDLSRPIVAEVGGEGVDVVGGPARRQLGQLAGPRRDAVHALARRHARPPAGDLGRARPRRRRGHRDGRATTAPAGHGCSTLGPRR